MLTDLLVTGAMILLWLVRIIDRLGPMLALQPRKRFAKDTVLIVDGTLVPTRDHTIAERSKNYRYSTNHKVEDEDPAQGNSVPVGGASRAGLRQPQVIPVMTTFTSLPILTHKLPMPLRSSWDWVTPFFFQDVMQPVYARKPSMSQ